jgi:hypothetical protein
VSLFTIWALGLIFIPCNLGKLSVFDVAAPTPYELGVSRSRKKLLLEASTSPFVRWRQPGIHGVMNQVGTRDFAKGIALRARQKSNK